MCIIFWYAISEKKQPQLYMWKNVSVRSLDVVLNIVNSTAEQHCRALFPLADSDFDYLYFILQNFHFYLVIVLYCFFILSLEIFVSIYSNDAFLFKLHCLLRDDRSWHGKHFSWTLKMKFKNHLMTLVHDIRLFMMFIRCMHDSLKEKKFWW